MKKEEMELLVLDLLFDKDYEWTRIHELIKMRAPISPKMRDYYMNPFERINIFFQKIIRDKVD
jgi:hypothetical protein